MTAHKNISGTYHLSVADILQVVYQVCLERELNTWIRQYVADQENPPADVRSRKPLRAAKVEVMDVEGEPGWYQVALSVRPHFKFMGANFELSLVGRLDRE